MILRGKDVEHHNIINDMMLTNEVTYRPQPGMEGIPKDSNVMLVGLKSLFGKILEVAISTYLIINGYNSG